MENPSNQKAFSCEEKIAALETRLEALEASQESLEKWRRRLREGKEFLSVGILHAQGLELQYEGKRRVWLMATEAGAEFCLYDGDQQMRVNISVDSSEENSSLIQIFGDKARPLTPEEQERETKGATHLCQHEEVVRIGAAEGGGLIALFDNEAKPRVVARAQSFGGSVAATNKNGEVLAVLRSSDKGGQLQLMPDTWSELDGGVPVRAVELEATAAGGACILREATETSGQNNFAALTAREGHSMLLMGDDNCSQRVALTTIAQITSLRLHHTDEAPEVMICSCSNTASVELKASGGQSLGDWTAVSDPQGALAQQCAFHLKDGQGNKRIAAFATDSIASLQVSDENAQERISMLASGELGGLRVCDSDGTERILMQADPTLLVRDSQSRVVGLFDTNSGGRLSLFAAPSPREEVEMVEESEAAGETIEDTTQVLKSGRSFLHGPATRQRVVLAANPEGAGLVLHGGLTSEEQILLSASGGASSLQIKDPEATPHLALASSPEGGQIAVLNDAGAPRLLIGVKDNCGGLTLMRSGGELDALLSGDENGGQLLLFDEHGERSVTLP